MHTVVREDVACPLGINEVHQQRGLGVILASAEVGVVLCGRRSVRCGPLPPPQADAPWLSFRGLTQAKQGTRNKETRKKRKRNRKRIDTGIDELPQEEGSRTHCGTTNTRRQGSGSPLAATSPHEGEEDGGVDRRDR